MKKKDCITSTGYNENEKSFYVNQTNKVWIETSKELLEICSRCFDFVWCDKKRDLLLLLNLNDDISKKTEVQK